MIILMFVVFPLFGSIREISKEISALQEDMVIFENDFIRANDFQKSYDSLEITSEKISSRLISSSVPIELIKFLEDAARDAGLTIEISPAAAAGSSDQFLGFSINLAGDFANTMKFLGKIESGSYFIKTQRIHMRRGAQYAGQLMTSLEIKALTKI